MAYLEFAYHLASKPDCKGVIPLFLQMKGIFNAYCLGIDESYRVLDIELGIHGHVGANGRQYLTGHGGFAAAAATCDADHESLLVGSAHARGESIQPG